MSSEIIKDHNLNCESRPSSRKKICNICGAEVYNIKVHVQSVHTIQSRSHFCHICEKGFKEKEVLTKHINGVHAERKPCPHCGQKVRLLDDHIMSVHTPDELKPFQCSECTKGFISKIQLKKHQMNVHLKLRPYKCRYGCDDSYNDSSNRNSHEKKKHGKLFTTAEEEKEKRLREENAT